MLKIRVTIPALEPSITRVGAIISSMRNWAAPALADVARILRESIERQAAEIPPRSEVAQRLRPTGGVQNLLKLIDEDVTKSTAALRLSIAGGELLHRGGTTAAGAMIPGKTVPARPFMRLTTDARGKTLDRLQEEFRAILRGGL
jgi:phage gpG-like protein